MELINRCWLQTHEKSLERFQKKNGFEMSNSLFRKTMENVIWHNGNKLVITDRRICNIVSEPNYHRAKCFSGNFLAIEMNKTEVKMKKAGIFRSVNSRYDQDSHI